jgi:dTDP-glucose 4,6-dehydratase
MRVLVTGAAGFLGSHLTDRLLAEDHEVIGVDNLSTGTLDNISHLAREPRFSFEERDICLPFDLGAVDFVFNFASPSNPQDYLRLPIETLHAGAIGTENALRIAARYGAGFLQASSSECYDDAPMDSLSDSYCGNANTASPRSVYDASKRLAEVLTMAYHRTRGVDTRLVRIFDTYGPRLRPGDGQIASTFITQALLGEPLTIVGNGSQKYTLCYVSDVIEGIIRLSRTHEHLPVNIGSPFEVTVRECADLAVEVTRSTSNLEFKGSPENEPVRLCPDISKARRLLGWEPHISLKEGLGKSLGYFVSRMDAQEPAAHIERSEEISGTGTYGAPFSKVLWPRTFNLFRSGLMPAAETAPSGRLRPDRSSKSGSRE